jgi:RNA polymerase-binding transcription factor DksA
VPAKWRWHFRVLLALQGQLFQARKELRTAAAEPIEPHSLDEADSATDEFDHDLALTQLSAEQDALYEVNAALDRVQDGSYGRCQETGRAIPAARLRAVPWTRFTREVEARRERNGVANKARMSQPGTVRDLGRIWLEPEEQADDAGENPPAPPKDEALSQRRLPPAEPEKRTAAARGGKPRRRRGRTK